MASPSTPIEARERARAYAAAMNVAATQYEFCTLVAEQEYADTLAVLKAGGEDPELVRSLEDSLSFCHALAKGGELVPTKPTGALVPDPATPPAGAAPGPAKPSGSGSSTKPTPARPSAPAGAAGSAWGAALSEPIFPGLDVPRWVLLAALVLYLADERGRRG